MSRKLLLAAIAAAFIVACKKDEPQPEEAKARDPEVLVTNISTQLKGADSISTFTKSLETVNLSKEETAEGITLFAPLNSARATVSSSKAASVLDTGATATLPDSVVKNHIVKGVFRLTDLTNGKVMTGLNGKQLKVKRAGDTIWINGVLLNARELAASSDQVVYVVRGTLQGTTVIDSAYSSTDFSLAMQDIETNVAAWYRNVVVLDALLSQDVAIDSLAPSLQTLNQRISNFQFNGSEASITQFWQTGYQQISRLNLLEEKVKSMVSNRGQNIARIKALRAFIYLQLLTYFENIALNTSTGTPTALTNNNRPAVVNYIKAELAAAAAELPSQSANTSLNQLSVKSLQAKLALLEKDYQNVLSFTNAVISSNRYSLAAPATIYTSSSEIIWNASASLGSPYSGFFFGRQNLPYIRITEVYLMNAEAKLSLGQDTTVQQTMAIIANRSGSPVPQPSMNGLRNLWRAQMRREGNSFPNLIRWNIASDLLAPKGFIANKHYRLPIPTAVLNLYPTLTPNSPY